MDFMRWHAENVKGALVWSLAGEQTRHCKESAERQDIAVSTLLERWMYTVKIQQSRPNHSYYVAVNKKLSDFQRDML